MYKIFCTGLTCCDLIFPGLKSFPEIGKEVASSDFLIKAGGAANTAMALTKLGVETIYCTMLGNDITGNIVYDYMKNIGMDMSAVMKDDKYRTSVSAVLSAESDRGFATYFYENKSDVIMQQMNRYISSCSHVHAFLSDCLTMPIVETAVKNNKTISIDMGWDETIKIENIKNILSKCNVFMCNELEACSVADTDDPKDAVNKLSEYVDTVIVKLGGQGSIVKTHDSLIKIPAVKGLNVVDTTGGGDLYAAGFLYGYMNKWDIEKAARFASASGGLAVTFYGGMDEKYNIENVNNLYNSLAK